MTLYFSTHSSTYHLLRSFIPVSIQTHFSKKFSLSEYLELNPIYVITESFDTENILEIPDFPYEKCILLGSKSDTLQNIFPLMDKILKYFPYGYNEEEVFRYLIQLYYVQKKGSIKSLKNADMNIIGSSDCIQKVNRDIAQYGPVDETVTILGETGTGKELIALALHKYSGYSGEFVPKSCCNLQESIMESDLFGSRRGAFTDSINRIGLFEKAINGTLFLDEIGDMSLTAQSKLLRVVETKTINPVGSTDFKSVNTRIITATSRDLKSMVKKGTFREDLYYRLNTLIINIAPLRHRKEDIPLLCHYFLDKKKIKKNLTLKAFNKLLDYNWPGNIRELKSTISRAAIRSGYEDEICEKHIIFH
ncbi:MAG: hypothetical protein B6241_08475 [Spirochaetaceae bacterium 4572_59]|nr:MAG: hypothetical protein B6241_08475 [Spirochaetaceae bacterium 4572_59]